MTCSADSDQLFFQAPLLLPNHLMNIMVMVIGMGSYARAWEPRLPLIKTDLATATAECPVFQQKISTLRTQNSTIVHDNQPET